MHRALDDPRVFEVVGCKSAQIAWTDGVLLNYLGRRIDIDPCAMVGLFSTGKAAKDFNREKFVPMVEVTPTLANKIPVHKARDPDNGWDYKGFPGGFLKLVGSNTPDGGKSTPAPLVFVEEPDDTNSNVKGQGDMITILRERFKTFPRRKMIFGGTPTIDGFSRIWAAYQGSDRRKFWVPCVSCGEYQTLSWENVRWSKDAAFNHEVFGHNRPETARYCCPHCGCLWTDAEKNRAVRKLEERAEAAFYGVAGFYINEVYSPFPGSTMDKLAEKYLAAQHALKQGDDTKARSFRNNTEGLPYAYKSSIPTAEKLKERAEDYAELTVPWGGLVLTAGVDVQHDRLAVVIRAWGRGEESWLVWWGEIPGRTLLVKWNNDGTMNAEESGAWYELDQLLLGAFPHASGAMLRVRAASIDSSDGQTQDAVYSYVRRRAPRGFMAIKGASHDVGKDVFTPPRLSVDMNARNKPHPSGVKPYMVGTQVAKDLILGVDEQGGRIKLEGNGPGRMHWYRSVRPDYYDQITAEVKVPHKTVRGRFVWACLAGRRNEGTDCEVYALHSARSLKLYLWRDDRWDAEEAALKQPTLFGESAPTPVRAPGHVDQVEPDASDSEGQGSEAADQPTGETKAPAAAPPVQTYGQPVKPKKAAKTNGLSRSGWSAKKW